MVKYVTIAWSTDVSAKAIGLSDMPVSSDVLMVLVLGSGSRMQMGEHLAKIFPVVLHSA